MKEGINTNRKKLVMMSPVGWCTVYPDNMRNLIIQQFVNAMIWKNFGIFLKELYYHGTIYVKDLLNHIKEINIIHQFIFCSILVWEKY